MAAAGRALFSPRLREPFLRANAQQQQAQRSPHQFLHRGLLEYRRRQTAPAQGAGAGLRLPLRHGPGHARLQGQGARREGRRARIHAEDLFPGQRPDRQRTRFLEHGPPAAAQRHRRLRSRADRLPGRAERGRHSDTGLPEQPGRRGLAWFNQFWTNLTPRIVSAGYKPCIGSIAVGNPGSLSDLDPFVPALRQAQAAGGAWSYHAYTIQYSTDVAVELWYSLRYRQFYSYFAQQGYSDLLNLPLILTEGGVDQSGTPATSGWQYRGTAAQYERWLNWFDRQLGQDAYVLGCTLFENGDPTGWSSFDLEPIAGWFRNYLTGPTTWPLPPTGVSASLTQAAPSSSPGPTPRSRRLPTPSSAPPTAAAPSPCWARASPKACH